MSRMLDLKLNTLAYDENDFNFNLFNVMLMPAN